MSSQEQASNQAGKLRRHCVCGMQLSFNTNQKENQPTEREKYSGCVNRMKLILAPCMLLLTWQDNICFCRASGSGLQRKLCFIKEPIFPPPWRGRLEKVLRCTTWNCYFVETEHYPGDGLVFVITKFTQTWNRIPVKENQYVLVGEITPPALV